jgi:hypothetical protein
MQNPESKGPEIFLPPKARKKGRGHSSNLGFQADFVATDSDSDQGCASNTIQTQPLLHFA